MRLILTKSWLLEGSKSGLCTLTQVENTQDMYPNLRFSIAIVFTVIEVHVSIEYHDSHYRPALA